MPSNHNSTDPARTKTNSDKEIWSRKDFEKKRKTLIKISLKKTCYKIVDQGVESIEIPLEKPKSLVDHISNFENGQVYEIV